MWTPSAPAARASPGESLTMKRIPARAAAEAQARASARSASSDNARSRNCTTSAPPRASAGITSASRFAAMRAGATTYTRASASRRFR